MQDKSYESRIRYSRQLLLKDWSYQKQEKIRSLVLQTNSIAEPLLWSAASLGVEHFNLLDVSKYSPAFIERLRKFNPEIRIKETPVDERVGLNSDLLGEVLLHSGDRSLHSFYQLKKSFHCSDEEGTAEQVILEVHRTSKASDTMRLFIPRNLGLWWVASTPIIMDMLSEI